MVVQKKLYTVEEYEEFIARPENRERRFELIHGEIVEKMPTEKHGLVAGNFFAALWNYVKPRKLGRVAIEVRHGLKQDKHNDRIPDVSCNLDMDRPIVEKGAVPRMPDIAVEVQSPSNSRQQMRDKAEYYLQNGSRLVWLACIEDQTVDECTLGEDGQMHIKTYGMDDELSGGEVLPGFTLAVRDIFDVE
jgi:Uma2 family endonuclease